MSAGLIHLAEQFVHAARHSADMTQLVRHVDDVGREIGFRYFALVHHVSLRRSAPTLIESSNYPAVWSDLFVNRRIFLDDPVLLASQRTVVAFAWEQVGRLLPLSRRHKTVLASAQREGLGAGITIPANVPGEPNGSCSFATKSGRPLPCHRKLLIAQLIGLHAFERARQLRGLPVEGEMPPHLTPREEECLRLLVGGASDKLIARQLRLSPETARRYLKTARAAYGAATRTELIVKALRDGLVSFDDAIPPYG
jgi:LuxR family quorum-sensing system transcriptional regulator CciR